VFQSGVDIGANCCSFHLVQMFELQKLLDADALKRILYASKDDDDDDDKHNVVDDRRSSNSTTTTTTTTTTASSTSSSSSSSTTTTNAVGFGLLMHCNDGDDDSVDACN
jgi:hypothetical protein